MYSEPSWSKAAFTDWEEYYDYLACNWPPKVLETFDEKLNLALSELQKNPVLYKTISPASSLYRWRIDRYISLYYRVQGTSIVIVHFQHAARNPNRLGL